MVRGELLRVKLINTMDYFADKNAEKLVWMVFNAANDVTRHELCDEPSDPNAPEGMQTMMSIRQFMDETYEREALEKEFEAYKAKKIADAETWEYFKQEQEEEGIIYERRKIKTMASYQ